MELVGNEFETKQKLSELSSKDCQLILQKNTNWFEGYQVESIELGVSGVLEKGTITRLFVSAKGNGGMKIYNEKIVCKARLL